MTGDTAIVPTAPIALVGATMNVSAGAVNTTAGEFGITNGATLNLSGGVMNSSTVALDEQQRVHTYRRRAPTTTFTSQSGERR